ncbi:MAG: precorrin-4 C(11)-methyltransferase, partial [Pseudomonadota bacterium]
ADCPVAVVFRASWPDETVIEGTLSTIEDAVRAAKLTRTALILVGRVLGETRFSDSALYDPAHSHIFRNRKTASQG